MQTPFVIHLHTGYGPDHYDIMIQTGAALATWQCAVSPIDIVAGGQIPAVKIADHRLEYLSYEGPVSRNRGRVQALDRGECEIISQSPDRWQVRFEGALLAWTLEFRLQQENQWSITLA